MLELKRAGEEPLIERRSRLPNWWPFAWRIVAVFALILLMVLFHWFERDALKDQLDGQISFADAIYFTMISATTTGFGDIVPVTTSARMFDALVVTPARVFLLLILAGSAYLFFARHSFERFLMRRIQRKLSNHIVVAGFGTKGSEAVRELLARGTPGNEIVVLDEDEEALEVAEDLGCIVGKGDATQSGVLRDAHVDRARLLIIAAGRDATSLLICLTTRRIAPDVRVTISIQSEDNEALARHAGANVVVNPLSFAGLLLASSGDGAYIPDYLADLASMGGRVRLWERKVRPEEVGKSIKEIPDGLGLRVVRAGVPYGFWQAEAAALQEGDVLLEIRPTINERVAA